MHTIMAATALGDIEYADLGQGSPVLVIHGSPGGVDQGAAMARFIVAAGMRAIVVSRPGYLRTPLTQDVATIDQQADLFAALMDSLGIGRFAVLCWSGGGPSAYRLAVQYPGRVTALVALAALSFKHPMGADLAEWIMFSTRFGALLLKAMTKFAPRQLVSATLSSEGNLTREQVAEQTAQVFGDDVKREFVLALAGAVSHRPPRKAGWNNDKLQFAAIEGLELGKILAPVLLVQGDVDADVQPEYSDFASDAIPNSELVSMHLGGHLCVFTAADSDVVQRRIVEFLRGDS